MPIVIGAKPESTFADPVGLLTDCHRRIERFLAVLVQVSQQANGGPLNSEQGASLETALRYFREAAPKHTADEEKTLFPRLRSLDQREVKEALAQIEALEADHHRAEAAHAEIDRLGQEWLTSGSMRAPALARFGQLVRELEQLYRGHIAVEERDVFPLAAAVLKRAEREAMGAEMVARRGLRQG